MDGPLEFEPMRERNLKIKKAKQKKLGKLLLDKSSYVAEWQRAKIKSYPLGFDLCDVVFTLFRVADFIAQPREEIKQKAKST